MKAKEAPERIYSIPTEGGFYLTAIKPEPPFAYGIEYTRTDAFIEKAVSYLNSKLYDWVQTTNPNQRSYANTIMKQDFIEDFKKAMKGE